MGRLSVFFRDFLLQNNSLFRKNLVLRTTDFSRPHTHQKSGRETRQKLSIDPVLVVQAMSGAKVAVVGAGIVGLSVALKLVEKYGTTIDLTIVSETFLQQTTSFGAGGLWEPYAIEGTKCNCCN